MQTRTQLGMSLGQMASGLLTGYDGARQRGVLDGMRANELASQIEAHEAMRNKYDAETNLLHRQGDLGNDDNLARTALLALGIGGDDAVGDYTKFSKTGTYEPQTVPLAFTNGGDAKPTPEYVSRFPDVAKTVATLRTALAIGDKNLDLPKTLQGIQRNNISAGITPESAPRVALELSALDGKDPTNITEASLVQRIADGGDYGTLAKALLAGKGKGMFDGSANSVTNVLDGKQVLNDYGRSQVTENAARADQARAGAKENLAQADLAGVRAKNIKDGKGDGSQIKEKDFARIRDDIRADYNAMYPFNQLDGNRGKNAPDYNTFTKQWLRQYNIDENEFFRNTNPVNTPKPSQQSAAYQEYQDAFNRAAGHPDIQRKITERARQAGVVK